MPSRSSNSVNVFWFNKDDVWEAFSPYLEKLLSDRPEVREVILFGSFAAGIPTPGSDVDLAVILDQTSLPFLERGKHYRPNRFPVGIDLFVYTTQEMNRMRQDNPFFLKSIQDNGLSLVNRRPAGNLTKS